MKCPTCPHLDASRMPAGWTPAPECCVDRMPGHRALAARLAAQPRAPRGRKGGGGGEAAMTTVREIMALTPLSRADAERISPALEGAPAFVVSSFWALAKSRVYSVDELLERIAALKSLAR